VRRSLGEDNFVGAVVTDRRYQNSGSGSVGGVDASVRFQQNYRIEAQGLVSYTDEPVRLGDTDRLIEEARFNSADSTFDRGKHTVALDGETYAGHAAYVSLEREARHWQSDIEYWDTAPTFRADNGFVVRNNERRLAWSNEYVFYPDNAWLDQISPRSIAWSRWNTYSMRKNRTFENWITFSFKRQTSLLIGYDYMEERFRDVYFDGMDLYYAELNTAFSDMLQFGFWAGWGDRIARTAQPRPFLGEGSSVDAWATVKPWQRLVIEPYFTYGLVRDKDTHDIFFEGYIWRVKTNYQFTRELFLRLVLQYDDFSGLLNIEPLLSYELNPFTVVYLGASVNELDFDHETLDPAARTGDGFEPTEWQVFFKFQYFFRM
jgi:hypothetical protein